MRRALVPVLVLAFAGCGEESAEPPTPRLPAALARDLAERSDAVAASLATGDDCNAREQAEELHRTLIDAINEGRVPAELQEELSGAANALAARIECAPAAPPPPPPPPPPPAEPATTEEEDEGGEGNDEKRDERQPRTEETKTDEELVPPETVIPTETDELGEIVPTDTVVNTITDVVPEGG